MRFLAPRVPALNVVTLALAAAVLPQPALAQQPFIVDDVDVTPRRTFHLEFSSQTDILRRSARPARWQNTADWELAFGAMERVEISVLVPYLAIAYDAQVPGTSRGVGDTSVGAKFRITRDPEAVHAWGASVSVELPTGDAARGLGSGLVDYGLNVSSQHQVSPGWTLRANGGLVLAGNAQTGAVGIRERGPVLTGGGSAVAAVSASVALGAEVTLAWSHRATLGRSYAGLQVGGNIAAAERLSLDFGIQIGWLEASPRWGLQVGTSIDF